MDLTTLATTLTALIGLTKTVGEGIMDEKVKAQAINLNDSIIDLQSAIFELQANNHTLLEQNRALGNEMAKLKEWQVEAAKYQLAELAPGVLVYAYQKNQDNTEPAHSLCPNCYQKQFKSLLQVKYKDSRGTHYFCPQCDIGLTDPVNRTPLDMPISIRRRDRGF